MLYKNDRDSRIAVFKDTASECRSNGRLKAAIKKSIASQQLILEGAEIPGLASEPIYEQDADIVISKKRSLEAAQVYIGQKVCVLNFASATNPGGGVTKGSSAQEECLCRCSTLYSCLNESADKVGFHYRHKNMLASGEMDARYNDDCIYTPGVVVFKSDTALPQILPEDEWYSVDIITCAAPNLRAKPNNLMNPEPGSKAVRLKDSELMALHAKRTGRILDIAKANGAEVVILGAFGCGAFQNPPAVVARGMMEAVQSHRRDFKTIEFAVYCSPRDTANYDAFKRMI